MSIKKSLDFPELLYKTKKVPPDFLIYARDADSFFTKFLIVYVVQNRILRPSKILISETYSIKELCVTKLETYG